MPATYYASRAQYPINSKEDPITLEEFRDFVEKDPTLIWWDENGYVLEDFPDDQRKKVAVFKDDKGAPLEIIYSATFPGSLKFVLERSTKAAKEKILNVTQLFKAQLFKDFTVSKSNKPLDSL